MIKDSLGGRLLPDNLQWLWVGGVDEIKEKTEREY